MKNHTVDSQYTIAPYRRLVRYSVLLSLFISAITLIPIADDGNLSLKVLLISFGSSLSIGIVAPTIGWLLLHVTMPLAQRRGWSPIRAWSLAAMLGGLTGTWLYAFIYGFVFVSARNRGEFISFWLLMGVVLSIITTVLFYIAERIQHDLQRGRLAVRHNIALAEELRLARMIQTALLPKQPPILETFRIAGGCFSAREVGGDLLSYDVADDGSLFVSVGDVTGKNVSAAMLMGVTLAVLQAKIQDHRESATILQEVDRWLYAKAYRNQLVALQVAHFQPTTRCMTLANAGQLAPILRRQHDVHYLESHNGLPIGSQLRGTYQQSSFQLQPDDTLIFYTDGVIETQNHAGELWGFDRLLATIQAMPLGTQPHGYLETIHHMLERWGNQHEQHDDMTLVIVQMTTP